MKTITYEQYLRMEKHIKELQDQGVIFLFKKNKFKLILGVSLIGLGVLTLPFPTGSVLMIATGCYFLGIGTSDLFIFRDEIIRKIKNKIKERK